MRSNSKAALATTLRLNGYSTAQFGKCHEVPPWQTSPIGPFDAWPSGGGGFEYFYGFIGGENNQYYPALYEGTNPVEPEKTPEEGYHLTEDLTDRAIDWVRTQKALAPEKPFFVYFAPGATHAPHHVAPEWSDKYAGKFAAGWDAERQSIFERQQALGVVGADAQLTPRPDAIPAWDDMDPALKPVLEREMEVYAGFLEHTDFHVGRLVDAIESIGALENTLVYYIIGDNGASAEGTLNGAFNEMANFNGMAALETPEFMASVKDKLGTVDAYNHYSVGWAWAMCAPFQWTKQVASHWGGTRNGTIVHWPAGIRAKGGLRSQFAHVIDVAPTILEAAGLPEPTCVNGVQQAPIEGASMVYSFDTGDAPERHDLQYFEMFGNRGIYHRGWSAVTRHSTPWLSTGAAAVRRRRLGALRRRDRLDAGARPRRGAARQARRAAAAVADRGDQVQRAAARRPRGRAGQPGARRPADADPRQLAGALPRHGPPLREQRRRTSRTGRSPSPPTLDVPAAAPNGVIIAQGGRFGGWTLYIRDGQAKFVYNVLGIQEFPIAATEPIPAGSHQVRVEFAYDGGGLAKGGTVTLYYDGSAVGNGRVDADPADDLLGRRDDRHRLRFRDAGQRRLRRVQPVQRQHRRGPDRCRRRRPDHLIDPEDVARVAISRQ